MDNGTGTPICGYRITEKLHETASSVVYRARRSSDDAAVVLKILQPHDPSPRALSRFRREYELTSRLHSDGVVNVRTIEELDKTLMMVEDDIGGYSLASWLNRRSLTQEEFLFLAVQLAHAVAQLHAADVIHKDLNPSNIIWNPDTGQLQIIDFGVAIRSGNLTLAPESLDKVQGTLAYLSPEQTGRIGRSIDCRSDLYSLGVTFYNLLAGQAPFASHDAMELVHCHLARLPTGVCEVNSDVPPILSAIVMKLLEKDPEARYQSAYGLKADLEQCRQALSQHQSLEAVQFPLGQRDFSHQLRIPQRLYGRESEIAALLQAFDRVRSGRAEAVFIAGYSGVGKTSLVGEAHAPMAMRRGRFTSGKFDQLKRNIPYHAITQALNDLFRSFLAEGQDVLQDWKRTILSAVGPNGQILVDVIPNLELVIGKQPEVQPVGSTEAKHRFNLVFLQFIRALCDSDHPLVIFLDDLQWADRSTLDLVELVVTDPDSQYLLFIGAYRDNEVPEGHPLLRMIDRMGGRSCVSTMVLQPLDLSHVTALLTDATVGRSPGLQPLAELVYAKTAGNPFFLNQFLMALYERKLLRFCPDHLAWVWDTTQIVSQNITDNMVDLMVCRLQLLPQSLQHVCQLAACVGNHFDLKTLAIVTARSPSEVLREVLQIISAGFVLPLDERYSQFLREDCPPGINPEFKFLHDRVQQGAYSLVPAERRPQTHAVIGRLLLATYSCQELDEHVFSVVEHLNLAQDLLDAEERLSSARLNLRAGVKARESAAYEPASRYLEQGLALLPAGHWRDHYELSLYLFQEAAAASYLCGTFERASVLMADVLEHGKTIHDKIRTYRLKMELEAALLHTPRVLELTREVLQMLGIQLVEQAPEVSDFDRILNLPPMTNTAAGAALPILSNAVPAAYQSDVDFLRYVVYTMVGLSVQYGNDPYSAFAYVMYGLLLSGSPDTAKEGYRLGELALRILDKCNAKAIECRVKHIFHSHIRFTQDPLRVAIDPMADAIRAGLAVGDLEFVAYISNIRCQNILFSDRDLMHVHSEYEEQLRLMKKIRIEHGITFASIFRQLVLNLIGRSRDATKLVGPDFDETTVASRLKAVNQRNLLAYLYTSKVMLYYWFGDRQAAYEHAKTLLDEGYDRAMSSMYVQHVFYFYCSLAFLGHYNALAASERAKCMQQVDLYQGQMEVLSKHCPDNYRTFYTLVRAEKARICGRLWQAARFYDQAVDCARRYQQLQLEALGNELAGRCWMDSAKEDFALLYLRKAHSCYGRWGARRKVAHLEQEYPLLLADTRVTAGTTSVISALDVATVLKASHAISREIDLTSLLSSVTGIIAENAGAQKAVLVLCANGNVAVCAIASGTGDTQGLPNEPVEGSRQLPETVVRYVLRTGEDLILREATADARFSLDPYVVEHRLKSVLCLPIRVKDRVTGAVYLENNLLAGAFTAERLEVVALLASQAGISLENARLFDEKERFARELLREIAERKQAQERLQESERDLFITLHSIGDAVISTDQRGAVTRMNPVAERLTGWSIAEARGKPVDDVFHVVNTVSRCKMDSIVEQVTGACDFVELAPDAVLVTRAGAQIRVAVSGSLIKSQAHDIRGAVLVFRDITAQCEVEAQRRQSQKMEAVGQLASGIAHDFNNLLAGILGSADLLAYRLRDNPSGHELAQMIIGACARAGNLVQKLLAFSRKGKDTTEVVDVHALLDRVSAILMGTIDKRIKIDVFANAQHPFIRIDPSLMENVILNLGINARDAMPDGGRLVFATRNVDCVDMRSALRQGIGQTQYIELRVEDTGVGMTEEVTARAFDPFFTTKAVGKGTGLGLSIVYNTINASQGTVDIESEVGRGTVIRVFLPVVPDQDYAQQQVRTEDELPVRGKGRILIVDDEAAVRHVASGMLVQLGYDVVFATDGADAVELYKREHATIDLVILDIAMPRMTGVESYYVLKQINPDLKVLMSSGFVQGVELDQLIRDGVAGFVAKPYRMLELSKTIAEALGTGRPALPATFRAPERAIPPNAKLHS